MPPKAKKISPWVKCDNCLVDISSKELKNHTNTSCPSTPKSWCIPFVQNDALYTYLDVNDCDEQMKIDANIRDKVIFISHSALQFCELVIGRPVIISSDDKKLPSFVRHAWPLHSSSVTNVIISPKCLEPSWQDTEHVKVNICPFKYISHEADSIHISVSDKNVINNSAFLNVLKFSQIGKILSKFNSVNVLFYGKNISVNIVNIFVDNSNKIDNEWYLITETTKWVFFSDERVKAIKMSAFVVGGMDNIIKDVKNIMKFAFENSIYHSNLKPMRSVLLYGPSGTGKSLICKFIAAEGNVNVININGTEIYSKFYGETEAALKKLFSEAIQNSPSIILIDEIDTLCPKRGSIASEQEKRIISTVATLLDNLHETKNSVFVLTNSNKPDLLDPSLRRYGRIDREIEIPIPGKICRLDILSKLLHGIDHCMEAHDIEMIANVAHGFVGADISNLCTQASMHMLNTNKHSKLQLSDFQWALNQVKPSAMREVLIDIPNVKWSDIGGQDYLKLKLKQAVEWPLKYSDVFTNLGIKPPSGVLMYGPPGCSKTMIAKALANESQLNFLSIKGPELFSKWVGESERAVRDLFRKARQVAPSIVFFDEIDALGTERSKMNNGSNVQERVLAQILTELDGISPLGNVIIVAATNRPDKIDSALLRPGRLDRIVYVPLPSKETRLAILNIKLSKMSLAPDVLIDYLVSRTDGYSGAEIHAVCHEAALKALEEDIKCKEVNLSHFELALNIIVPRTPPSLLSLYDNFEKNHLR